MGDTGPKVSYIAQYLWPQDILLDVEVDGKPQLFDEIGQHMETEHAISGTAVTQGLLRREKVASTGLGNGIALPHARVETLSRMQLAYLRLKSAVPFEAPDGRPVMDVLVILVPKRPTEGHLLILADAAQMLCDSRFIGRLHACTHPVEVKSLFESFRSL